MRFIASFRADSADLAINEILAVLPGAKQEEWLDPGTALLSAPGEFSAFSADFRAKKPIFTRHIFPVLEEIPFSEPERSALPISGCFSVRVRKTKGGREAAAAAAALARLYEARGAAFDGAEKSAVLSGVLDGERLFLGVSRAEENLSARAGGVFVFDEGGALSRAEGKLRELFELFPGLPRRGRALDLGASPGGWTRVLLGRGLSVVAVDPAALHSSLSGAQGLEFVRASAQDFLKRPGGGFDLIANDMKMDAAQSAGLTCLFAERLAPGGAAVLTLKLPEKKRTATLKKAFAILEKQYEIAFARQLYNNRSEVTAVLFKRGD